ncbi:MAG TPA: adenylyl-sulfate kinase [Nitrososphaerales archaeon]|nr:adenylyl-sulfate kinase [Nitrososphaerales archaeon]
MLRSPLTAENNYRYGALSHAKGTVIWFNGLPGSGKSTIAKMVLQELLSQKFNFEYVSMDAIRSKIFPNPQYTDAERDAAYRALVLIGSFLSKNGVNVILDGTGHKIVWRELARQEIGASFLEVYVKCPVEVCMQREASRENQPAIRANLYRDALKRLATGKRLEGLGKVPGVDEPFEESENPEITVDSFANDAKECAVVILGDLGKRFLLR